MNECDELAFNIDPANIDGYGFQAALDAVARAMPGEDPRGTIVSNVAWTLWQSSREKVRAVRKWKPVSEERYGEMLEILWPALWEGPGFLVGEAWDHVTCKVRGVECAAFAAFVRVDGQHYECTTPVTTAEFRTLTPDVLRAEIGA